MVKPSPEVSIEELDISPPSGYVAGHSKVRGIDLFIPIQTGEKKPDVIDFKCPQCGATIGYQVERGRLKCDHCGYEETPEQTPLGRSAEAFEFQTETVERSERGWGDERKDMACQRCGGVISVPCDTLSYSCPFCGSNKVLYREPLEDVLRPRYLIPFKVSPQECEASMRSWLGSSWMIPSGLRSAAKPEKFTPLYIPYWTFSATTRATWKASVAHTATETYVENGQIKRREKTVWREEAGKVEKNFTNLLVPATTRLNMAALARVDAYKIDDLVLYEPRYLAGMRAQAYDLPLEEGWQAGRTIMRERTRQACLDRATGEAVRNFKMSLDFTDEEWRYILVPVYTTIYHYGEKPYQVTINGQNGRTSGPRPVDWEKVWLVIAGILSPGLLLFLIGWLFASHKSGPVTAAVGLFLLFVGAVISFFLVRQGQEIENV